MKQVIPRGMLVVPDSVCVCVSVEKLNVESQGLRVCVWIHAGNIPPVVSCLGWPAVTFLDRAVTVTPTGSSCPEYHWRAINSLPFTVRKWRGWPRNRLWLSHTSLSVKIMSTHHTSSTAHFGTTPKLYNHLSSISNKAEKFPFALSSKRIWTVFNVNKLLLLSKSSCDPSTECSFTVDTLISNNSSHSGTDDTSLTSLYTVSFHWILSLFVCFLSVYKVFCVYCDKADSEPYNEKKKKQYSN